ncbi:hypothetical protein DUI87_18860 [Hirundo rustica rustica]|uniref:Uncharacterized protein n=1 Tax=Hirundo rustica rustica TaxID=333673 RepID=A0A3M0JU05_HIRRU|nr:hypothetical protein DUI87_18860 [Hirundo rustica rustica]
MITRILRDPSPEHNPRITECSGLEGTHNTIESGPWHINVGSEFQAELPELQSRAPSEDEEPASLVWKPWGEDDSDMQKPDRVRELLDMASSRGVPRAEAKLELALHCLHQARGSVPEALEMLLSGGPPQLPGPPLADYHYADSDRWTPEEKESFEKALHTYGKDFHLIQKQTVDSSSNLRGQHDQHPVSYPPTAAPCGTLNYKGNLRIPWLRAK